MTINEGLSHSVVTDIAQDGYGNLWFATGNGMCKYDGRFFETYLPDKSSPKYSLPFYLVNAIKKDHWGNLWISTLKGFAYYSLKEDKIYNLNHLLDTTILTKVADFSTTIMLNKDSILYLISEELISYDLKTKTLKKYPFSLFGGRNNPKLEFVNFDRHENLLFTTLKGLFKIVRQSDPIPSKINNELITLSENKPFIYVLSESKIYVITQNQKIIIYNPEADAIERVVSFKGRIHNANISEFRPINGVISGNKLLVATDNGILISDLSLNSFQLLKHNSYDKNSISSNQINCIFKDSNGVVFLGTNKGGVSYVDLNSLYFTSYYNIPNDPKSLPYDNILHLYEDHKKNLWIGTFNNGFIRKNPTDGSFDVFNADTKPQSGLEWMLGTCKFIQDEDKNLYILNWINGLYVVAKDQVSSKSIVFKNLFKKENSCIQLPPWSCRDMIIDRKGWLWIVSFGFSIQKFHTKTGACEFLNPNKNVAHDLHRQPFWCIAEDKYGYKWMGTDNAGVFRVNDDFSEIQQFKNDISDTNSLPSDHIKCILPDSMGNVWLGTGGSGLVKMDAKSGKILKNFTVKHGLSNNTIYTITADKDGILWLTTDYGLNALDPKNGTIRNFYSRDGLTNDEYGFNSAHLTSDFKLLVGGDKGFDEFVPAKVQKNSTLAIPSVVRLYVNNQWITAGKAFHKNVLFNENLNNEPHIRFTRKENSFTFILASLHYSNPSNNKIKYRLLNYEDNWTEVNNLEANITFTNLPGGDYTLEVLAANSHGYWNPNPKKVYITIVPYFYERWEFYLICFVLVVGISFRYVKERERKSREYKEKLEKEIEAHTLEIKQQNQELIATRAKEEQQNWISQQVSALTEILNKNQGSLKQTSALLLTQIVKSTQAVGGLLLRYNDSDDPHFEILAAYGPNKIMLSKTRFEKDEGMISVCFFQKRSLYINELPPDYFKVTSGLGEQNPAYVVLTPLHSEEIAVGVLELAFFKEIPEKTKILLDTIKEIVALNFQSRILTEKMQVYLQESKVINDSYKQQEEVMRTFIEEFAVKEESYKRTIADLESKILNAKENLVK